MTTSLASERAEISPIDRHRVASGIPELVRRGETGLLVNERDIDGIATAIEWYAAHRQELAAQGRGLVQRMSDIDKTISTLEQRFSTTIQSAVTADS